MSLNRTDTRGSVDTGGTQGLEVEECTFLTHDGGIRNPDTPSGGTWCVVVPLVLFFGRVTLVSLDLVADVSGWCFYATGTQAPA